MSTCESLVIVCSACVISTPQVITSVAVSSTWTVHSTAIEMGDPWPACACGGSLMHFQPDEADPDHMLGVCEGCAQWYLIEIVVR